MVNTQHIPSGGRCSMAKVVKKHSISSELAQKMVDEAVAKAREIGVSENVAILDDGGNLKAFRRMDGAPILSIEIAQNKAYTALFGVPTQDFFDFTQFVEANGIRFAYRRFRHGRWRADRLQPAL